MKVKCPVCGRMAEYKDNPFRPFCSKRCKDIDLMNWADERYRIPGQKVRKDENDDKDRPE